MTEIPKEFQNLVADFESHHIEGFMRNTNQPISVDLVSLIEGNLWTGGCIGGVRLSNDFMHVISLYPWEQYAVGPDTQVTEIYMHDAGYLPDLDDLRHAVDTVADAVADGKTLVHCQAGLNRSGLVAALYLIQQGRTPRQAIDLLRDRRSPAVLSNSYFNNWLMTGAVEWLSSSS